MTTTNSITRKRKIMASESLNSCNRKTMASASVNWSNIPVDVFGLIASKITSVEDYLALGAVCKWWGFVSKQNLNFIDLRLNQWLMQVSYRRENGLFYSLNSEKFIKIDLPQIAGRYCFGSPFGWLLTYKLKSFDDNMINLFNPLSKTCIPLPNPTLPLNLSYFHIRKAILTSPPRSPNCLVIISYNGGALAFTRPGDTVWYPIPTLDHLWEDCIYFNTNLYGCTSDGHLYVFDLSSAKQPDIAVAAAASFAPSPWDIHLTFNEASNSNFLVDLGGELCMLIMFTNREYSTTTYEVYKIDMETKGWKRVMSLGNWCLVLEGSDGVFPVNVNDSVCQHKKMSPGCVYWPNSSRFQTFVWNVEKYRLVEPHSDDNRDIYTRLFPTIRINPSLLP